MLPSEGGSYIRDPNTGEILRTEAPTEPQARVDSEAGASAEVGRLPETEPAMGDDAGTAPRVKRA